MNNTRLTTRFQFVQYIEHRPQNMQKIDRWMKRLEAASLGVIVAFFLTALQVSINSTDINTIMIPVAWFSFAASCTLLIAVAGLHSVFTGVFPPVLLPERSQYFTTGFGALVMGWLMIALAIAAALFWGVFAYATVFYDITLLETSIRIFSIVVGGGALIAVGTALLKQALKSR